MPPNLQEVKFRFSRRRSAKVMGSLAERETEPKEGESVRGILVTHNLSSKLVAPADLATFTPLRVGSIRSKLHVPYAGSLPTLRLLLTEMFSSVQEQQTKSEMDVDDTDAVDDHQTSIPETLFTLGRHPHTVQITMGQQDSMATVEWMASPSSDVLADAVVALLMHAQSSPASIRLTSQPCRHRSFSGGSDNLDGSNKKLKRDGEDSNDGDSMSVMASRMRFLYATLREQFQNVEAVYDEGAGKASYEIVTDIGLGTNAATDSDDTGVDPSDGIKCLVSVEFTSGEAEEAKVEVECRDEKLGQRVQMCLRNVATGLLPIKL
jgi:Pre-mRNA 3'-end-processing endonuclease polyadenylation factor C-term